MILTLIFIIELILGIALVYLAYQANNAEKLIEEIRKTKPELLKDENVRDMSAEDFRRTSYGFMALIILLMFMFTAAL